MVFTSDHMPSLDSTLAATKRVFLQEALNFFKSSSSVRMRPWPLPGVASVEEEVAVPKDLAAVSKEAAHLSSLSNTWFGRSVGGATVVVGPPHKGASKQVL